MPPRLLSVAVWHQTRPRNGLLDFADPAGYDGRYNRAGDAGVWYASLTETRRLGRVHSPLAWR